MAFKLQDCLGTNFFIKFKAPSRQPGDVAQMGRAGGKEGQVFLTIKAKAALLCCRGNAGLQPDCYQQPNWKKYRLGGKKYNTQNTYLNECDAVLYKSIPSLLS